jgi:hypothetical protein
METELSRSILSWAAAEAWSGHMPEQCGLPVCRKPALNRAWYISGFLHYFCLMVQSVIFGGSCGLICVLNLRRVCFEGDGVSGMGFAGLAALPGHLGCG